MSPLFGAFQLVLAGDLEEISTRAAEFLAEPDARARGNDAGERQPSIFNRLRA